MIEFLSPVSKSVTTYRENLPIGTLGRQIKPYTEEGGMPSTEGVTFAILGVKENRLNIEYSEADINFDMCRKALYSLYPGNWSSKIIDLGDIEKGASPEDTRFALKEIVTALLNANIIPVILGGGQEVVFGQYRAYDSYKKMVNMVNVDNRFDLGNADSDMNNKSYVGKIIVEQPYNLFNYSVLGYQSYLNPPDEIALMDKLFFDAYRLGEVTSNITMAEPIFRNADIVTLDLSAIKSSEMSYENNNNPNGFDGREICALSRYAGISNQVTSFGVYEIGQGMNESSAMLVAQILWYFIEGVNFRIQDEDFDNETLFTTYVVPLSDVDLTFKKSNKSERWWIELPFFSNLHNKSKRQALLPCTYDDYLDACNHKIPERWWKARLKSEMA